ncbi:13350_t:CDS:1, partial [Acaulospora colombiana]
PTFQGPRAGEETWIVWTSLRFKVGAGAQKTIEARTVRAKMIIMEYFMLDLLSED